MSVRDNALAGDEFSEPHQRLLDTLRRGRIPGWRSPTSIRRLTVVELAFQLRQILVWPSPGARTRRSITRCGCCGGCSTSVR